MSCKKNFLTDKNKRQNSAGISRTTALSTLSKPQSAHSQQLEIEVYYFCKSAHSYACDIPSISTVSEIKLLSIYLSSNLSWDTHIYNITRLASSRLHALYVLRNAFHKKYLKGNCSLKIFLRCCSIKGTNDLCTGRFVAKVSLTPARGVKVRKSCMSVVQWARSSLDASSKR